MAGKPYGEILDEMDHEAKYLHDPWSVSEVITTLRHARVFITSREKMHPTGIDLYDDLLVRLERAASLVSSQNKTSEG